MSGGSCVESWPPFEPALLYFEPSSCARREKWEDEEEQKEVEEDEVLEWTRTLRGTGVLTPVRREAEVYLARLIEEEKKRVAVVVQTKEREAMMATGGEIHYQTNLRDDALISARLQSARDFLAASGFDTDRITVKAGMSPNAGGYAAEAIEARNAALEGEGSAAAPAACCA